MATIRFSDELEEREFYEQLPKGEQLRFICELDLDWKGNFEEVLILKAIATAVSHRIRELHPTCGMVALETDLETRGWTADSLVGISQNLRGMHGCRSQLWAIPEEFRDLGIHRKGFAPLSSTLSSLALWSDHWFPGFHERSCLRPLPVTSSFLNIPPSLPAVSGGWHV
ncbi:uncharacterized protein PAC_16644 [Phialocephala subalpina]|uniref:Uncharacterized protein n=1 Tax=Phialocephala subalpina TaxID=576137 RepID=A0A1L7XNY9_9HELO|nr:uncharacterized protein PAC_16644 [Phialocephala subalpina]